MPELFKKLAKDIDAFNSVYSPFKLQLFDGSVGELLNNKTPRDLNFELVIPQTSSEDVLD